MPNIVLQLRSSTPSTDSNSKNSAISFDNLNKKILTKEPEIIRLLGECVTKDPSLTRSSVRIHRTLQTDPQAAIAASNAITILNAAQVNLSGRDFKGVRIADADLSDAILTNTNLSHADLRNVQLN